MEIRARQASGRGLDPTMHGRGSNVK